MIYRREVFAERLDHVIYYGFHILIFSIPLFFLPFAKEWFTIPKVTLLRIGVILILSCWSLKQLFSKRLEFLRTKLDLFVLLFLLSVSISTLYSVHLTTSLLGKFGRYEGLTTLIVYGIIFFLAAQTFYDARKVSALLNAAILATSLVSIYALFQYLGYDFIPKTELSWEPNRSFSTLGNPVMLGGYLAIMLPVILSRYLESIALKRKLALGQGYKLRLALYAAAFLVSFAALVTTFSRGAWLAALAALLLFTFLLGKQVLTKEVGYLILVLISIFLIVGALNCLRVTSLPERNISVLDRVTSLRKIKEGSVGSRILIWQSSLKMIAARPVLGWGPDAFHLAFPSFSSPAFVRLEGPSKKADNAHNYFLQLAATEGFLGLLTYVALLTFFFWKAFGFVLSLKRAENDHGDGPRGYHDSRMATGSPPHKKNANAKSAGLSCRFPEKTPLRSHIHHAPLAVYHLYSGILAGMVGYVVYLLSGINTLEMGTLFWTLLGVVSVQVARRGKSTSKTFSPVLSAVGIVVTVAVAVFGSVTSLEPLLADVRYASAEKLERDGYLDQAIEQERGALRANPYQDRYARYLGRLCLSAGDQTGALSSFLQAKRINQLDADNSSHLAGLYIQQALQGEFAKFALAEKELSYILELNPYSPVARTGLGFVYLSTNRFEEAIRELQKGIRLDSSDAEAYQYLGVSYEGLGQTSKAVLAYRKAVTLDPSREEAKAGLKRLGEGLESP